MYTINDIPVSRCIRTLLAWRQKIGSDNWYKKMHIVIESGIITSSGSSGVVTPRGSCVTGNTVTPILAQLLNTDTISERVIIYSASNLTYDNIDQVINPQAIMLSLAETFEGDLYSELLKKDVDIPENALSYHFTKLSSTRAMQLFNSPDCISGNGKCPFMKGVQ